MAPDEAERPQDFRDRLDGAMSARPEPLNALPPATNKYLLGVEGIGDPVALILQGRKSAAQEDVTRGEANTELAKRRQRATWVAQQLLPHERQVRGWLARSRLPGEEIDEVMQEAYCRIAMLPAVDHIEHPMAYLYSVARNLVLRRIKRQQVVMLDVVADIECFSDDSLRSPEHRAESRMDYERVLAIIAGLPERCRQVVELRKLQGCRFPLRIDPVGA